VQDVQTYCRASRRVAFIGWFNGVVFVLLAAWLHETARAVGALPVVDGEEFFESKIRPLLVDHCYECHAGDKHDGGLRLDSLPGWQAGGDSGGIIVPGDPDASLLVGAIRYTGESLQMPPDGKLSDDKIALITEWIRMGAPDPRRVAPLPSGALPSGTKLAPMTLEQARNHWSLQPIPLHAVPPTARIEAHENAIDQFVRARLSAEGLQPSPRADPRTLVRRAYLFLIGLPPPYEAVERFAADPSDEAFTTIVDQLLARPEYGQRWGRHWLDVARYADTTDKSTDGERRIPFAHTYRDYVIESLNTDKPFDRFVIEQIAADRLPAEAAPDLRALGFLTVGRRFEGNAEAAQLIIDDRIDVIGRGMLGLTVSCARCHDHKFDAIPTADYYSLYGILASLREPMDLPEMNTASSGDAVVKYRDARAALFDEYEKHIDTCLVKTNRLLRELAPEYLQYVVKESPHHRTTDGFIPRDTPKGLLVAGGPPRWIALIAKSVHSGEKEFRLWPVFMALPRDGFAAAAAKIISEAARHPDQHDSQVLASLQGSPPSSMLDVADIFGRLIVDGLASSTRSGLAALVADATSPLQIGREMIAADFELPFNEIQIISNDENLAAGAIRGRLVTLEAEAPVCRAQAVVALAQPVDPHVMVRGDRHKVGPGVSRRIPRVLDAVDDQTYSDDGRLQLAHAVASPRNPLTARVIVNRIWQQHFGTGLVATADNFGAVGERPSHPELLDHLAGYFVQHGWSLKSLHRYLLTSATWQQSSSPQSAALTLDPGNRLLWRMSPRRLEFEPLRDSLLYVAGRLDTQTGGRSQLLDDKNVRRAVYGYTDRFRIPATLRNFDVANPDQSIPRRTETIHPLQSLYFLNSGFLRAQAEAVAQQPEIAAALEATDRIAAMYRRVLSRQPAAEEVLLARQYLGETPTAEQWTDFVHVLLMSNEFIYCD